MSFSMPRCLKFLLVLAFTASFTVCFSQNTLQIGERILNFHATITVDTSSDITITESIRVNVLGRDIKRGIFRTLPTSRNIKNQTFYVRYKILSITKNGVAEPYHTKNENGNFVIYLGDENVYLDPGIYNFEISYQTFRQISFWDGYDELYWNVCGNNWTFPIDSVSATVTLPPGADIVQNACYTGNYGSKEQNCHSTPLSTTEMSWTANALNPHEGLTVAVGFKKGIVHEPQAPSYLKPDNLKNYLIGFWVLLASWLGLLWSKYGKDPEAPTVIPEYEAPQGLSPATLGYLNDTKFSPKLVTAAIINLAVKGSIKIAETKTKGLLGLIKSTHYSISKTQNSFKTLSDEEKVLYDKIGSGIEITGKYSPSVENLVSSFKSGLVDKNKKLLTQGSNRKKVIFPFLLVSAVYWFVLISAYNNFYDGVGLVLGVALYVVCAILYLSIYSIAALRYKSAWLWVLPVFPPSIILLISFLLKLPPNAFLWSYLFLTLSLLALTVFKYLIEQPSPEILKVRAEIDGFKMYLSAAENQPLKFFNPPAITPEVFEKMLPYAVAFGVDDIWGKKFSKFLEAKQQVYENHWYAGSTAGFSSSLSHSFTQGFTSSLSSSSTQPSSSGSGSGGGGSSGGGGGGGGGGGW